MAYLRGKLRFESSDTFQPWSAAEDVVYDVSCSPPPAGTITRHNPALKAKMQLLSAFLQKDEQDRMLALAPKTGEAGLTLDVLLADLASAYVWTTLDIDLTKIDPSWEKPVPCFNTSARIVVTGSTYEIRAYATEAVTFGAQTYPKDDEVANFRVQVPTSYKFVRRYRWNPDCCTGAARSQGPDESAWFPEVEYKIDTNWRLYPKPYRWGVDPYRLDPYPYVPKPDPSPQPQPTPPPGHSGRDLPGGEHVIVGGDHPLIDTKPSNLSPEEKERMRRTLERILREF